jgi:hypothetical protein
MINFNGEKGDDIKAAKGSEILVPTLQPLQNLRPSACISA